VEGEAAEILKTGTLSDHLDPVLALELCLDQGKRYRWDLGVLADGIAVTH